MTMFLRTRRGRFTAGIALACAALLATGVGSAAAKGGTAKPPANPAPFIVPPHPAVAGPAFSVNIFDIHQFDTTGFIQAADVDGSVCGGAVPAAQFGGHVTVNGIKVTVPCNSIVQMPANTLTWVQAVDLTTHPDLTIGKAYPSFEAHVVGNTTGDVHTAGLVYLSQQGANSGQGIITSIDYATGRIHVGSKAGGVDKVVLEINDPNGRFGRTQSPDNRFSVDDQNPTIHAGTGYPMCVPRTTTDPTVAGNADDPLCPQKNRPKPVNGTCRDFVQAGVVPLPTGGNLSPPAAGAVYCGHYVAKSVTDATRVATDPDPRQQAPFEVGDYITYAGTLIKGTGAAGLAGADYISVHTIDASVGIFTQPGTQPAYVAIGDFRVGSADPPAPGAVATAITGVREETTNRLVLEAETSDVVTPVDIYFNDVNPATGVVTPRWVTPNAMTGENNGPVVITGVAPAADTVVGGGIDTQFVAVNETRARLRATKAPLAILTSPTRTVSVTQRTLCLPSLSVMPPGSAYPAGQQNLEMGKANTPDCRTSQPAANGLFAGYYTAPTFEYVFPENIVQGDPVVPNDFWSLGFLVNGEGPGTGPLSPTPW